MQQAMFLLALASGSAATARTAALADAWEGAADSASKSPVGRVVKLLTDMHARLEADKKEEADLEATLTCFCENNGKEKSASVEAAKAELEQLASEIEARGKQDEVLAGEIQAQEKDAASMKASFDAAEAQRAKEAESNHKEIVELTQNLETMKAAVMVLTRHHATAFPQMSKAFLEEGEQHGSKGNPEQDSNALDAWMAAKGFEPLDSKAVGDVDAHIGKLLRHSAPKRNAQGYTGSEMSMLTKAQKVMQNFIQANDMEYAPFAGEILGIIKQMQDQFSKELSELEATDKQQAEDFGEMKDRLQKAITTSEKVLKQKEAKKAANAQARADAIEAVDALKGSLTADEAFLVDLEKNCGNRDKEFAERRKTRDLELQAVSEAIQILNADDSRDLFSKSLGSTALVQSKPNLTYPVSNMTNGAKPASLLQLGARHQRLSARERAVMVLRSARPSAWLQLAASRIEVSRDGFTRVRAAMERMVTELKQQQKDEVAHKDWCKSTLHENDMDTAAGERAQQLQDAQHETLEQTLSDLQDHVKQTHAEVKDLEVNMQRANQDRMEQNKAFQKSVDEQRATVAVLQRAIDKLAGFYDAQAAALVQSAKAAEAARLVHKNATHALEAQKAIGAARDSRAVAAHAAPAAAPTAHDTRAAFSGAIHKMASELKKLKAPSFVQLKDDPPAELAGGLGEYKKHGAGGSVLTLLRSLVTEARQLEQEATAAEQSAQDGYVGFMADAHKSHAALGRAIVAATEQQAEAEVAMAQLKEDRAAQASDLEELAAKRAAAHTACDFVLKNFDTRQVARQTEIDALKQAMGILLGAA